MYTSNRGGTISLDLNGKKLTDSLEIAPTKNDAAPLAWRQWYHWNVKKDLAVASLPKGKHVLTVNILSNSNMNLAYLDFKERKSAAPGGAGCEKRDLVAKAIIVGSSSRSAEPSRRAC